MCHVLVIAPKPESDEKRVAFEKDKIREIKKTLVSPTTQFVYGETKNSKKTIERYMKRHPKAKVFNEMLN